MLYTQIDSGFSLSPLSGGDNANNEVEERSGTRLEPTYYDFYQIRVRNETYPLLSDEETAQLCRLVQTKNDPAALEKLVLHNLRLATRVAHSAWRFGNVGLTSADVMQETIIGLINGIRKWDKRRGEKLSTCATWWIMSSVSRAIKDHSHTIRVPSRAGELYAKINRVRKDLTHELQRKPTDAEIAQKSWISEQQVAKTILDMHLAQVQSYEEIVSSDVGGMVEPVNSYGYGSALFEDHAQSPEEYVAAKEEVRETIKVLRDIMSQLKSLPKRDRIIFCESYGINKRFVPVLRRKIAARVHISPDGLRRNRIVTWARLRQAGIHVNETWLMLAIQRLHELERKIHCEIKL